MAIEIAAWRFTEHVLDEKSRILKRLKEEERSKQKEIQDLNTLRILKDIEQDLNRLSNNWRVTK